MARIYLSSTFKDLEDFRREVAASLRTLRHDVVGMEEYIAEGSRPLAKCLDDVASCDVYVGIIAMRYGYVPEEPANPGRYSITECEYRHAKSRNRECLLFLADEDSWPTGKTDLKSGENGKGERVESFRAALRAEHTVSTFRTSTELAKLVCNAVTLWVQKHATSVDEAVAAVPAVPLMREVRHAALLAYSEAHDQADAGALAEHLRGRGLGILQAPRALFARTEGDLRDLEEQVVSAHAVVAWVTPALLAQLLARENEVARAFELIEARTGCVILLLKGVAETELPAAWRRTLVLDADAPGAADLILPEISLRSPTVGDRTVGLPCVVVAMNAIEAADILANHDRILRPELKPGSYDQFLKLKAALEAGGDPLQRYGSRERDWKPFGRESVDLIAADIATRLNSQAGSGARRRLIKLQHYPFEGWRNPALGLRPIYHAIAASGCLAIVDEMSLFHPDLRKFSRTFFGSPQVSVVTISPLDASTSSFNQLLESETRAQLAGAFERFELEYDPACEFGIGEERRLRRWLHASLPDTLDNLRAPPPDRGKLQSFREMVGEQRKRGIDEAIYAGGGRP